MKTNFSIQKRSGIVAIQLGSVALMTWAGTVGAQLFTEIDPGFPAMARPCVVWGDYDGDGDLEDPGHTRPILRQVLSGGPSVKRSEVK